MNLMRLCWLNKNGVYISEFAHLMFVKDVFNIDEKGIQEKI